MNTIVTFAGARGCRRLNHVLAALALALGGGAAWSQDVVSVPAAHLHHAEGSVAYAPSGDKEWHDVQPRRLLKRGDRLWVDRGSRAEIQAGGHALRLNGETQLVLENVGETATQVSLTQGSVVATVTGMKPGDSFEVGTPNLAFRARQPGDYRIDVDAKQGFTRIVVLSGLAVVYGEKGEALEVRNGQRAVFRERSLTRVLQPAFAASDDFDRWALARRRGEPTVSMPSAAQSAPTPAPTTTLVNKGRDIVIAGPATALPGSRLAAAAQPAPARPQAQPPVAAVVTPQAPKAQAIPNATPATPVAVPLRVTAEAGPTPAQQAEAQARAKAQADADARARVQAEQRQRLAQQRAEDDRRAAQARAESDRRAAALEAKRADERHRSAITAKRAEEDRRHQAAKKEQESKRAATARREEERRALQAKKAAEEKRVAAARKAEAQRIADARRAQLARLQEQARREEQSAQARREQQARRAEEERRDELARREEQARREEDLRRQRALADQARRDQERRDQEVWLRQQQVQPAPYPYQPQPVRPAPMGVPARRVS